MPKRVNQQSHDILYASASLSRLDIAGGRTPAWQTLFFTLR
jgi:hypothetical protein